MGAGSAGSVVQTAGPCWGATPRAVPLHGGARGRGVNGSKGFIAASLSPPTPPGAVTPPEPARPVPGAVIGSAAQRSVLQGGPWQQQTDGQLPCWAGAAARAAGRWAAGSAARRPTEAALSPGQSRS